MTLGRRMSRAWLHFLVARSTEYCWLNFIISSHETTINIVFDLNFVWQWYSLSYLTSSLHKLKSFFDVKFSSQFIIPNMQFKSQHDFFQREKQYLFEWIGISNNRHFKIELHELEFFFFALPLTNPTYGFMMYSTTFVICGLQNWVRCSSFTSCTFDT